MAKLNHRTKSDGHIKIISESKVCLTSLYNGLMEMWSIQFSSQDIDKTQDSTPQWGDDGDHDVAPGVTSVKCNSSVYPIMITVATACNAVVECIQGEDEGPLCSNNSISTIILIVTCLAFVSIYLGLKCSHIISLKMNRNQERLQLTENRSVEVVATLWK